MFCQTLYYTGAFIFFILVLFFQLQLMFGDICNSFSTVLPSSPEHSLRLFPLILQLEGNEPDVFQWTDFGVDCIINTSIRDLFVLETGLKV